MAAECEISQYPTPWAHLSAMAAVVDEQHVARAGQLHLLRDRSLQITRLALP